MKTLVKKLDILIDNDNMDVISPYPQELSSYFSSLSSIEEKEKNSFLDFYNTLQEYGIWDDIMCFYPFFGKNVSDCKFGIKGEQLTINDGATFDKGLMLPGVSIPMVSPFLDGKTGQHTFYIGIPYKGNLSEGKYFVGYTTKRSNGQYNQFSYNRDGNIISFMGTYSKISETDTVIAEALMTKREIIYNGVEKVKDESVSLGESVDFGWKNNFGINISSSNNFTTPINMILIFNTFHDVEIENVVVNAIKLLQNDLKIIS